MAKAVAAFAAVLTVLLVAAPCPGLAAIAADEITALPGWDGTHLATSCSRTPLSSPPSHPFPSLPSSCVPL